MPPTSALTLLLIPKLSMHGKAVRWIGQYLNGTKDKGMIFMPDSSMGLEVFVDANFVGNWNRDEAPHDQDMARSHHGYIIKYMGCPIVWKSQLQMEIALSSTESEYTGLSYALRETIPMMELLKEMKSIGLPVTPANADVHCHVFKDNSGAIEMAHKYISIAHGPSTSMSNYIIFECMLNKKKFLCIPEVI